jgi:hypothetical protein
MKKLSDIINPINLTEASEEPLENSAEYIKFVKTLKSFGFKEAESSDKTYKSSRYTVLKLWGIPMRAGHWADVFIAIIDDEKPYSIIDETGSRRYKKVADLLKDLKKIMSGLDEETDSEEDGPTDNLSQALLLLDDIAEMTDEIYDTLSEQEEIDEQTLLTINNVYTQLDNAYAIIDEKYDIVVDNDEYDSMSEAANPETIKIGDKAQVKCLAPWGACRPGNIYNGVWKQAAWKDQLRLDLFDLPGATAHPPIFYNKDRKTVDIPKKFELVLKESTDLAEEVNYSKFRQLANLGLVDTTELPKIIAAMKSLDSGKPVSLVQKNIITNTFMNLIAIVTGDSSLLSKVKQSLNQE